MLKNTLIALLLLSSTAYAQQADPRYEICQQTRANAYAQVDDIAARLVKANSDLKTAQDRVQELENKYEPKKDVKK